MEHLQKIKYAHLQKIKYALWTLQCVYFSFKKCPIQTHDGANAKFSTYWEEKDYNNVAPLTQL